MTLAYSYIRFSSMAQRHGRSQQRQMEACQKWCERHPGVTLSDRTFLDEGRSGYSGEHLGEKGQLKRFIDFVDAGTIESGSYLIIESLDRLSRQSVWDALPLFVRLVKKGIKIVTLYDDRVYTDQSSEHDLILCILVMIRAHEESLTKSKRSKDNWRSAFKKARDEKKPIGKTISNWMKLEDGKYVVVPERAEVVRRIFDMCIRGHGLVAVAAALNQDHIPAFRGGTWCPSSVRCILVNRAVLGEYHPKDGGPVIKNYHEAIISPETFEAAHAKWDSRRKTKAAKQAANFQIWQGIAVCAACGSNMHSVRKPRVYLACANKRKGLCKSPNVRMDRSEEVFKLMLYWLGTRTLVEDDTSTLENELNVINGKLVALHKVKERHETALAQYDAPEAIYGLLIKNAGEIKEQEARRDELIAKLTADRDAVKDKHTFLAKLDVSLVERDERERANALLKHLQVKAYIGTGYFVTQAGISQMVFVDHDGKIGHLGVDDDWNYEDETDEHGNVIPMVRTPNYYYGEADMVAGQLLGMMKQGSPFISA